MYNASSTFRLLIAFLPTSPRCVPNYDLSYRNFAEDAICDPLNVGDAYIVALRLENNYIDLRKTSPTAFSCVRSYSSVVLKPQKAK